MTIPAGFAQVAVRYTGANLPTGAENVFGIRLDDPLLGPDDVCSAIANIWDTRVRPSLTNDVIITSVRTKFGPDDSGPFHELGVVLVGGDVANTSPPNVSYLITKNTAVGGRRGKGRMYIPGVNEGNVDDAGLLSGPAVASWTANIANVLADLDALSIPMVLLHEPSTIWVLDSNGQPRRQPVVGVVPTPDEVTSVGCGQKVATQRRRLRR